MMAPTHYISPTGVYVMFIFALAIDYWSVGPNSLRDRFAFLIYLGCFREAFNGSSLDRWLVEVTGSVVDKTKDWSRDAYIADADTRMVLGAVIAILAMYCVGCMVPDTWTQRLGRYASLAFTSRARTRINYRLMMCALLVGVMVDMSDGVIGWAAKTLVQLDVELVALLPGILFGTEHGNVLPTGTTPHPTVTPSSPR